MSHKKHSSELARLLHEHEKERKGKFEFPEKIEPRRPVLFAGFTVHQKASFILSLFMSRTETALAMKIKPKTVTKHIENGMKRLPLDERKRMEGLQKLRKQHAADWLTSASTGKRT